MPIQSDDLLINLQFQSELLIGQIDHQYSYVVQYQKEDKHTDLSSFYSPAKICLDQISLVLDNTTIIINMNMTTIVIDFHLN